MKPDEIFYRIATGSKRLRTILTPIGLCVFIGLLLLVIFGSLNTDKTLNFPDLLPGQIGISIGLVLLFLGSLYWIWCIIWFIKARGTPVPFNPPRELVTGGPYAWSRNPMLVGVFAFLFGVGFLLGSISMVFIWTPLFIIFNVIELKLVEEPELERRFGESYREYKKRVPMFFPRRIIANDLEE